MARALASPTIFEAASTALLSPGGRPSARWASLAMMWTRLLTSIEPAVARTSRPSSPVRLAAVNWAAQPIATGLRRPVDGRQPHRGTGTGSPGDRRLDAGQ